MLGTAAAMHEPEKIDEFFPPPAFTTTDTGFVTDDWYTPVYSSDAPPPPE